MRLLLEGKEDYHVLVRAGDLLEPHALLGVRRNGERDEVPELMYVDEGVLHAHDMLLRLVNEVESPEWVEQLLEQVQQPGVAVAGKAIFADRTVQLGGVLLVNDNRRARIMCSGLPGTAPATEDCSPSLATPVRSAGPAC